ncbi:hypothetical protein LY28_03650 [Ruminiclostridium sufflavum DSM 19573]|uniref:Uncharacterized protein n=1 Tax=Ruminiclostridium sufflavum DSM 19573 TaxID=1121337 RepID=A0A318XI06_9FIRM|nr:hypothetical protein [Ruminiclostridium sufflavum]PYG84336.1 hypothetical protein LY28_03650 [Ruminiclostridium sufflavum DSM 19573]
MKQKNKVLELLVYAALAIILIILYFMTKPYDIEPKPIFKASEASVQREVSQNDALSVQLQ